MIAIGLPLPTANADLDPEGTSVAPLVLPVPIDVPNAPSLGFADTTSKNCYSTNPCSLLVGDELDPPHPIESLSWSYGSDIDVGEHFEYKMWTMYPGGTIMLVIHWYCIKSASAVTCDLRHYAGEYNSRWWSLETRSLNEGNEFPEGHVGYDVTYTTSSVA